MGDSEVLLEYTAPRLGWARPLLDLFLGERERWFLWLPVALGSGVGLYFALPVEPPWWVGPAGLAGAGLTLARAKGRLALLLSSFVLLAFFLGLSAAQWRAHRSAAPVLAKRTGVVTVQGRVAEVEVRSGGRRVTIDELTLSPFKAPPPERVRLKVSAREPVPVAGNRISLRAVLMPPPEPAAPEAFQFPRQAWFKQLGAVGYAVSRPVLHESPDGGGWRESLARLRSDVTARILSRLEGTEGAVAAALITGERGAIPDKTMQQYRDSGLAHLLSISGLHMSLVAGLVFVGVRALLALAPPIALKYDIKKGTAATALAATFFYLLISGAGVPTQRAFVMTAIVLLAVLLDRTAISLRTVGWAAAAVLLWQPEALIGPSFQMSFAAVTGLIAAYETLAEKTRRWRGEGGRLWRIAGVYLIGVMATTVIASAATAPYAVFHFHRFTLYGLAANLLAVPVVGLWVMPMALAAMLVMPFGWEGPFLDAMGLGIRAVNGAAAGVASWDGAVLTLSPIPWATLVLMTFGGLWLCLWRRRWRMWGLAPMALGLALALPPAQPPDIRLSGDGRLMAARGEDGKLVPLPGSKGGNTFAKEVWRELEGAAAGIRSGASLRCDALGCTYEKNGWKVALIAAREALAEDCPWADLVISAFPIGRDCRHPSQIIDRFTLYREGSLSIWLDQDGPRILRAAEVMGQRLWTPKGWRASNTGAANR